MGNQIDQITNVQQIDFAKTNTYCLGYPSDFENLKVIQESPLLSKHIHDNINRLNDPKRLVSFKVTDCTLAVRLYNQSHGAVLVRRAQIIMSLFNSSVKMDQQSGLCLILFNNHYQLNTMNLRQIALARLVQKQPGQQTSSFHLFLNKQLCACNTTFKTIPAHDGKPPTLLSFIIVKQQAYG